MKFNQAQLTSAVKACANFVAGILTTHGAAKAASIINAEDTIGVLVFIAVWVYSHFFQHTDEKEATPTPLPDSKGGGVLPPALGLFFLCAASGLLLAGCAGSFNSQVFSSERLATDAGRNAVHGFNLYYRQATNGAPQADIEKLDKARAEVYSASISLGRSLNVTEGLRKAYVLNSADTNKTALQIAVGVLNSQSSNIWWTVQQFATNVTVIKK